MAEHNKQSSEYRYSSYSTIKRRDILLVQYYVYLLSFLVSQLKFLLLHCFKMYETYSLDKIKPTSQQPMDNKFDTCFYFNY